MRLLDVLSSSEGTGKTLFLEEVESGTRITHPSDVNIAKQDGLYVDIADDGTPIVPSETIDVHDARAAIELARRGLRIVQEATEETRNLIRNPDQYAELVERVRASLRPLTEQLKVPRPRAFIRDSTDVSPWS